MGAVAGEPCVRRFVIPAFKRAIVEQFGAEGRAEALALLQGDSQAELASELTPEGHWYPCRHVIAWSFAVWEGPAKRDRETMAKFMRRQWDLGTGVVRRVLLHMASPSAVVPRLGELWLKDNNAGEVTAELEGANGAAIWIKDTPFVDTPQARASMAEIYRHAFAQTRAKNVAETHALDGARTMVIKLRWT
ncbi:MAG: hypothetical protein ACXVEE_40425 [Polyangiales bacterium]